MGFLPSAQGNIWKEGKKLHFLLHINYDIFYRWCVYSFNSSVSKALIFELKSFKFESVRTHPFFHHFYFLYFLILLLSVKMAVLYENVINFIIIFETLKVLFSNILL